MNQNLIEFFQRDNMPNKTKDRAYVINLDEYAHVGTHFKDG